MKIWLDQISARPLLIIAAAIGLAVVSVLYAIRTLDFHTGQLDLISSKNPLIQLTKKVEPFERKDRFTVVVEADDPHEAVRFIDELARRISTDTRYFKGMDYRVDPQLFKKWALLYLSADELVNLADRLREFPHLMQELARSPDLVNFFRVINHELASRMIGELFTGFLKEEKPEKEGKQKENLDLGFLIVMLENLVEFLKGRDIYRSPWFSFFGEKGVDPDLEGYFWTDEKRLLLAFVTPVRQKETFNRALMSLRRLRQHIEQVTSSPLFSNVKVGVTGQEALKTDEMSTAFGDMSRAMWLSMAGVWVLMFLFLRHLTRPLVEMFSLGIGLCWTFGAAALAVGHLNILSVVFAPLLVGLGVDYGIHFFARYEEEEGSSHNVKDAIQRVFLGSGRGILLAGLSGALSLLPLVLTGFKGLVELGLITGMGILLTLLADFTVLPALSLYLAGPGHLKFLPSLFGRSFPKEKETRLRGAPWILMVALVLCGISFWGAMRVGFDLNPLRLQSKDTESVIWERRLIHGAGRSILHASSLARSVEELRLKSTAFSRLNSVEDVETIFSFLPEDQERKLRLLRSLDIDLPDAVRSEDLTPPDPKMLSGLIKRIRFKMQHEEADRWIGKRPIVEQMRVIRDLSLQAIDLLNRDEDPEADLARLQGVFVSDLKEAFDFLSSGVAVDREMRIWDLPTSIREQFIKEGVYLIRIYPMGDVWEREPLRRFVMELRQVDPQVTGDPVTLHDFTEQFKDACIKASIYASVAILLLLMVVFRGSLHAFLAMVPLVVGLIWTLGLMGLLGISFNVANSIFMPLIIGAGVEYGIIIIHRWRQSSDPEKGIPLGTAKGVTLAALTTTVGFGSLMVAHHRGIFSLGVLSFMGSLCVLLAAITVLPSMLSLMVKATGGKPK